LVEAVLRRNVVSLDARMNPLLAVADALFDGGVTMIDPAGAYRCVCAGSEHAPSVAEGRVAIAALEPVRATSPIFEAPAWLDLRPTAAPTVADELESPPKATGLPAFAEAARIAGSSDVATAADMVAPPAASQSDAARRMYALGVRTARRRAPQAPVTNADIAQASLDAHIPPTSPSLHAPPIEREVPIAAVRQPMGDRFADLTAPPLRRPVSTDDLLRRD
jgi:hypothetical protein